MRLFWGVIALVAITGLVFAVITLTGPGSELNTPPKAVPTLENEPLPDFKEDTAVSESSSDNDGLTGVPNFEESKAVNNQKAVNDPRIGEPVVSIPSVPLDDGNRSESSDTNSDSTPVTAPGTPTGLVVTPGLSQATLSWTAPTDDGGATISDYVVEQSTDDAIWSVFSDGTSAATTATVSGIANGTTYYFRVSAKNSAGTSSPTSSVSSNVGAPPGAPTSLTGTGTSRTAATLSWSAPTNTGGAPISDYVIEESTDGVSWSTVDDGVSASTSESLTGLVSGTTYFFRVSAKNSEGVGGSESTNKEWLLVPSAPSGLVITPGYSEATLAWTAPTDDGGATISDYVVEQSTDDANWTVFADGTSASPSATVADLSNGTTYYFRIKAINTIGTGNASDSLSSNMVAVPGQPQNVQWAETGDVCTPALSVTWDAPAEDGGEAITYVLERSNDEGGTWVTIVEGQSATTYDDSGYGAKAKYRVSARNSAGTGASDTSDSRTVAAVCA